MTGLRRTLLLWRAARYRRRADAIVARAIDEAEDLRRRAEDCEREAAELARRTAP
jgi:hypothetical protein